MQEKRGTVRDNILNWQKNVSYINPSGEVVNVNHESMGNNALAFVGTSGVQLGWLASQADLLSEDWYIVE